MTTPPRILIVDDEVVITTALQRLLHAAGYATAVAWSGQEALAYLGESSADLLILDVTMPQPDGLELCRRVRRDDPHTPILMLTARDQSPEKVAGLEAGADVYFTKPFDPAELVAQVRALLRMADRRRTPVSEELPLHCGPLALWPRQGRVTCNGQEIVLTPMEFGVLLFLIRQPGEVAGRETLLRDVWGYDFIGDTRTVDTHVQRLRGKIESDPTRPELLQTVRGFGYRLVCPASDSGSLHGSSTARSASTSATASSSLS